MARFIWSELRRRKGRTATLGVGILVAAVSFTLLTSAVHTTALQVRGTVARNWRVAYDILVRPTESFTALERNRSLVAGNYLSGIFGGITLDQWHQVEQTPGVTVAAPIANIGYILLNSHLAVPVNNALSLDPVQILRVHYTWLADHRLSRYPGTTDYLYFTRRYPLVARQGQILQRSASSDLLPVCSGFYQDQKDLRSPFDTANQESIYCFSSRSSGTNPLNWQGAHPFSGRGIGTFPSVGFPVLVAAIDPVQEARLVGLNKTLVAGRYLQEAETPKIVKCADLSVRSIPILASSQTFVDEFLQVSIEALRVGSAAELPRILAAGRARRFLHALSGSTVGNSIFPLTTSYQSLLHGLSQPCSPLFTYDSYRTASPITYRVMEDGHLAPVPVDNPASIWRTLTTGLTSAFTAAPVENQDVQFRRLDARLGSPTVESNVINLPTLRVIGQFDSSKLPGFSPLTQLPLESYYPPQAAPADARTNSLLGGQPNLPSFNLGNYLSQPPTVFTTLAAARAFTDARAFHGSNPDAPISAIRIRVAGVVGPDHRSRERIRLVAEAITERTGLTVDITAGSSPTPILVDLPTGKFGRPGLLLREGWIKKGVAVAIINAVDRKSLTLFMVILLVCGLFLANAGFASVRNRRSEIGVLLCMGWTRARIFAAILGELALVGFVAGVAGTAIAALLARALSLRMPTAEVLLVVPVGMGLATTAGLLPAWRAARRPPIDAVRPRATESKRAHGVKGATRMAVANLRRVPGRTLVGALALFVGVGALDVLLSVNFAYQRRLIGSLLGASVSIGAREVDYVSVVLVILLGGLSLADILYLNVLERAPELVTLCSMGWRETDVARLVGVEGLGIGLLGTLAGSVAGLVLASSLGGSLRAVSLAALFASLAGLLVTVAASLVPAVWAARSPASSILAEE